MIQFFAFLCCFFIANSIFMNNGIHASEVNQNDETTTIDQDEEESDEDIVLLSYPSGAGVGKLMQIAVKSSDEESDDAEDDDKGDNAVEDENDVKIQETACDKILEKEFADTKIIQLADAIAVDMGVVTRVSLNR